MANPLETTTYTITATSFAGCEATATITVNVIPPAYAFPNAFTPNGDSQNDVLQIRGISTYGAISIQNFRIFNRWGQLVFENGTAWDGTFNGELQPQDTYIYTATIVLPTGQTEEVKGDVLLIR